MMMRNAEKTGIAFEIKKAKETLADQLRRRKEGPTAGEQYCNRYIC
jgi:hypothetical protein